MKPFFETLSSWCMAVDPVLLVAVSSLVVVSLALVVVARRRTRSPYRFVESIPSVGPEEVPVVGSAPDQAELTAAQTASVGVETTAVGTDHPVDVEVAAETSAPATISVGMTQTRSSFLGRLRSFFTIRSRIDTSCLDELEELLISSDVGPRCASELVESVRKAVQSNQEVTPAALTELLKQGVRAHLIDVPPTHRIYSGEGVPLIVLVVGVNGVGKTTTVAKLAARYKAAGKRVLVVAADTFRAAAVHQLEEWAKRIGFEIVKGPENAKPASVVFDGMVAAKNNQYDVVLVDTAGRLHTKANLMQELEGVRNSITRHIPDGPHETVLVVDGVSGQNALMQARQFHEAVSLTGVVVTKLDGTPKGGIIIPISQELKVPVLYVGVGEKASDLLPFSADEFISGMFEQHEEKRAESVSGDGRVVCSIAS